MKRFTIVERVLHFLSRSSKHFCASMNYSGCLIVLQQKTTFSLSAMYFPMRKGNEDMKARFACYLPSSLYDPYYVSAIYMLQRRWAGVWGGAGQNGPRPYFTRLCLVSQQKCLKMVRLASPWDSHRETRTLHEAHLAISRSRTSERYHARGWKNNNVNYRGSCCPSVNTQRKFSRGVDE